MALLQGNALPNGGDPTPADYEADTPVAPATWEDAYGRITGDLLALASAFPVLVETRSDLGALPAPDAPAPRLVVVTADVDDRARLYYLHPVAIPAAGDAPDGAVASAVPDRYWVPVVYGPATPDGSGGYEPPPPPQTPPPAPRSSWSSLYRTPYNGGEYADGRPFEEAEVKATQAVPFLSLPQRRRTPEGDYEFVDRFADVDLSPFEPAEVQGGVRLHEVQFRLAASVRRDAAAGFTEPVTVELREHRTDGTTLTLATWRPALTAPYNSATIRFADHYALVAEGSSFEVRIGYCELWQGDQGLVVIHVPA
jgi:hypothetical protein